MKRNILHFLLLTVTLFMPAVLKAADKEAYAVYDNNGSLTFYYDAVKVIRTGKIYPINDVYNSNLFYFNNSDAGLPGWYDDRETLTYININKSFADYKPFSLSNWFYGLDKLQAIDGLANLNTSETLYFGATFYNCSSLKNLDLRGWKTPKAKVMYHMFCGCTALTNINLSTFDTSQVTDMAYMFTNCRALKGLQLTNFITKEVTTMERMFFYCQSLTTLNLSFFDTSKVKTFRQTFSNCISLKSIDVSNFNTSAVTVMAAMFQACRSLTQIDLGSFETNSVPYMNGMFAECAALRTIFVDSKKWGTNSLLSGEDMFLNCNRLTGGNGTKLADLTANDETGACIDGEGKPGLLTAVGEAPFSDYNRDGSTNIADAVYTVDNNGSAIDVTTIFDVISGKYGPNIPDHAPEGAKAVDLGLPSGTKWANMNVGATQPEENGLWFRWGDTQGRSDYPTYEGDEFYTKYKWYIYYGPSYADYYYTKYTVDRTYNGTVYKGDYKYRLDPEDDAATINWGGKWRMPTADEIEELVNNCKREFTKVNNVYGVLLTSKINGNSIFLPSYNYPGSNSSTSFYWSSEVLHGKGYEYDEDDNRVEYEEQQYEALCLMVNAYHPNNTLEYTSLERRYAEREQAFCVRAVR